MSPALSLRKEVTRIKKIVAMLQTKDFATKVPVPTVAVSTADFSTDLDRGPMWEQQNFYLIRGLRLYGYHALADALKAKSLRVVRDYYEKWGVGKRDGCSSSRNPVTSSFSLVQCVLCSL